MFPQNLSNPIAAATRGLDRTKHRPYVIIFIIALVVRLAYLFFVYTDVPALITEDSQTYLELAGTMVKTHSFNREVGGIISPETERVPIYILFLAIHRFLFSNYTLGSIVSQLVIDSLSCAAIAMIASSINKGILFLSGLAAALNPTSIIYGSLILTDSLFHFFVCLFILFLSRSLNSRRIRSIIPLGLSLGLATMTRDLMLYWPIVFIPLFFLYDLKKNKNAAFSFSRAALLSLTIFLCISPLMARNIMKFGSFSLTSHTGTHSMQWVLPLIWEVSQGTPWAKGTIKAERLFLEDPENSALVEQGSNPFKISQAKTQFAMKEFLKIGPLPIIQTWSIGAMTNLFAPSLIQIPPIKNLPRTGFFKTEASSKLEKIKNFILNNNNRTFGLTLIFGLLGVTICRILQMIGSLSWFLSHRNRFFFFLCMVWIGYILAINGPIATAKYRLPIEPILSIYLAMGIGSLIRRLHREPL